MANLNGLQQVLSAAVGVTQDQINKTQTQLANNVKILDPGSQGIVTRLSAQVTGYQSSSANLTQASNVLTVSQTALTQISSIIQQLQGLAAKANSSTVSSVDLTALQTSFRSLTTQITNLSSSAALNGTNLLTSGSILIQSGLDYTASSTTIISGVSVGSLTSALALLSISATGAIALASTNAYYLASSTYTGVFNIGAAEAISALGSALTGISAAQSSITASSSGLAALQTTVSSLGSSIQASVDAIQKPDQAALQAQLTSLNNQQSIDYYLVTQLNTEATALLSIFR